MAPLLDRIAARLAADWSEGWSEHERVQATGIVRTAFLDTAACVLAGRDEPATTVIAPWALAQGRTGSSSLLFGEQRASAPVAALVNAVAGHALDLDDVGLAGHPSVVLVPALLAELERSGGSGAAVVVAYAKGYAVWAELQRRIRVHLHARGWHPSAVFGVLAATAAVASLRGANPRQMANAIGIAASCASGVIANFGSMTKPLQIGRAAQAGVEAVELALAGVDASADALDARAGLLSALAGDVDRVDLAGEIPADFESTLQRLRPGIKKYPVCYALHRVIDGMLDLVAAHGLAPGDVASVEATISQTAADVVRHHAPRTVTEARFSMEFVLATAIARGRLGMPEVSAATLDDPVVRDLMARVATHTVDTRCPLEPSFAYTDEVAVTLRNGTRLESGPIRFARGHAQLPLSERELRAKLLACVRPGEEALAEAVIVRIDAALA